jgi:AcrR family transcriptional regulator
MGGLMDAVKSQAGPPSRRDRARATRLRIIRAAHQRFITHGYTGTRMSDIAADAGVAVQTVYFVFHTKAELLNACYESAVLGETHPVPPQQQPWHSALEHAPDAATAWRHFAAGYSQIAARVAALDDVVRSAGHEPDAAAVRARHEELRRDGYARIIARLSERFGLNPLLDAGQATDLMLTLGGNAVYRTLVLDYGWPHETFVDWLARSLCQQLTPSADASTTDRSVEKKRT